MNGIDVFIGIILLIGLFQGLKNGFFSEIGSLLGLIVGLWVAVVYHNDVEYLLAQQFTLGEGWLHLLGFLLPFVVLYIIFLAISGLISALFKAISLNWVNRLAGGLFCLIKGLFFMSILVNVYQRMDAEYHLLGKDRVVDSFFYEPVKEFAPMLIPTFKDLFNKHFDGDTSEEDMNQIHVA